MYFKTRSNHRVFNHRSTNALDGMVFILSFGREPNSWVTTESNAPRAGETNKRFYYWLNIVFVTLFFFFFEQSQIAKEGVFRVQVELVLRLHPVFDFLFRQNNLRRDLKTNAFLQHRLKIQLNFVETQLQRSCNIISRDIQLSNVQSK